VRPPAERGLNGYRNIQTWLDWGLILIIWSVSVLLAEGPEGFLNWRTRLDWVGDYLAHGIAWTVGLSTAEMYDPRRWRWPLATVARTMASVFTSTVVAFGLVELVTNIPDHLRLELVASALLFVVTGSVSRLIVFRTIPAEVVARRFLLLGAGVGASEFRREIDRMEDPLLLYAGAAPLPGDTPTEDLAPEANVDLVEAEALDRGVTDIVLCLREGMPDAVARRAMACAAAGMRLHSLPTVFAEIFGKAAVFAVGEEEWLMGVRWVERSRYATRVKRALDLGVGLILAAIAAPILALLAVLVMLDSPGGAFYRQERVGYRGRLFRPCKLRSMTVLTDEARARGETQKITRLGRILRPTRLDELPQLFQVLAGEMSLIGPRPEQPHLVERYIQEIPLYAQRHFVRPGITGWAQVKQDYAASIDDVPSKVQYDLYYISNLSIRLDMLVLLKTIEVILLGLGDRGDRTVPSA
jgi:exopolysaccharide biosynthesis polyprenyl glycosylphosphotransferase